MGANDLGGAATNDRRYCGVLGRDKGPRALHAGWARRLAARLAKAGFEDISVGHQPGRKLLRVDAENSAYAWIDLDALGVAIGLVASTPAGPDAARVLRLRKRNLVVWQVAGSAACIGQWLRGQSAACPGGQPLRLQAGALAQAGRDDGPITGWVDKALASWLRPRLLLAPDIDSRVGTEYGSSDSPWGPGPGRPAGGRPAVQEAGRRQRWNPLAARPRPAPAGPGAVALQPCGCGIQEALGLGALPLFLGALADLAGAAQWPFLAWRPGRHGHQPVSATACKPWWAKSRATS